MRYLIGTDFGINYTTSGKPLQAYVDSDWGGDLDNRRSCTRFILTLAEGPISWKSRQQKSVALLTMEAEYVALSEVVKEMICVRRLFIHMDGSVYVGGQTYINCYKVYQGQRVSAAE